MCAWNDQKGIGLIEIIISIAVIAIGVLGLLSAFPYGSNAAKTIKDEEAALELAQAKIEELSGLTYENAAVGAAENRVRLAASADDYFYNFTRTTLVSLLDQNLLATTTDIGFKKITATVYWPGGLNLGERSASLIYLKSKR